MTEEEVHDNEKAMAFGARLYVTARRGVVLEGEDLETLRASLRAAGYEGPMLQVRTADSAETLVGWVNHNSFAWRPPT